jgi:hypothetical protein
LQGSHSLLGLTALSRRKRAPGSKPISGFLRSQRRTILWCAPSETFSRTSQSSASIWLDILKIRCLADPLWESLGKKSCMAGRQSCFC